MKWKLGMVAGASALALAACGGSSGGDRTEEAKPGL